jgi:hypothetical protein
MHCTALLCCHLQLSHVLSYSTNSGSRIDCDIHGICNHDSSRKFSARYINWEVVALHTSSSSTAISSWLLCYTVLQSG